MNDLRWVADRERRDDFMKVHHDPYITSTKIFMFGGTLVGLTGFGIVVWQIYSYLRTGYWTKLSLILVFDVFPKDWTFVKWLTHPQSWFGLHKIVHWILELFPLSLACIGAGGCFAGKMLDELKDERKP